MAYAHSTPNTLPSATEEETPSKPPPAAPNGAINRPKRKKKASENSSATSDASFYEPYSVATDEEKRAWQGFCEIESDPAVFNTMLKEFGVKGVKLQEMFSLDEDMLAYLPKPVYGLIFLFQYSSHDAGEQTEECPDHIWFANQVTNNSCATVALLNLVSNMPELELGDDILRLKNFAQPFKPSLRGEMLANFKFIKRVHNSFARKIDILNIDAVLEEEFEEGQKKPRKKAKSHHDDDAAFHFVAYLPIGDEIWRLDGLDAFPQKVESIEAGQNWLSLLAPVLTARMCECQDGGIQFNLLALVRDPLTVAAEDLARNAKFLQAIDERIRELDASWEEKPPPQMAAGLIDARLVEAVELTEEEKRALGLIDTEKMARVRQAAIDRHDGLRARLEAEKASASSEEEKAKDRRNDYGPLTQAWLKMIAENGCMRELLDGSG